MDKRGRFKQALTAAAAVAALAGAPQPASSVSADREAQGVTALLAQPESVQELYRPVLKLSRLPDIPQTVGDRAWGWWKEQLGRCKHGWTAPNGHRLTGFQYFYLNFLAIPVQDKSANIAEWRAPYFRDNDEVIFSQLWRNSARTLANGLVVNARNHVEAKCRSIGWTQITLLGVAMWTFVFRPDRAIGMGYSDDEVIGIERLWFQESWARLHPMFRTWRGQLLEPVYNNKDKFSVGYKDKDAGGIVKEHNSVLFKIVADKAGVFKGLRLNLIIAIEAGKWRGDTLKLFYTENQDCLEMGDYKWGMFLIGGTSNAIVVKSSNYKEIYERCEAFNATRHFTPKTVVLLGFWDLQTGISDTRAALAWILAERKKREGDPDQYQQYVVENPLTIQECFTPSQSFAYDTARIQAHIGFLKANGFESMWVRGRLYEEQDYSRSRKTGKIKFRQDAGGKWLINRECLPKPGYKNLFVAGVDDTYLGADEADLKARDSRNCMVIWCQPTSHNLAKTNCPAAVFLHQTPDMDDIYDEFLLGLKFYDVRQCLYEYNHPGFVKYLQLAGEASRLWWVGNKPGLSVRGAKIKTELTFLGNRMFSEGWFQNITCLPILEALLVWGGKVNTDIGSALHLVLYLLDATKDRVVTRKTGYDGAADAVMDSDRRTVLGPRDELAESTRMLATQYHDAESRPASESAGRRGRGVTRLGPGHGSNQRTRTVTQYVES